MVCSHWNKILCVVRQVMQSRTNALARRSDLVDSTWDAVVHWLKPAMNEKQTITLCWASYVLSTMSMDPYFEAGNAMRGMYIGGTDWDKKTSLKVGATTWVLMTEWGSGLVVVMMVWGYKVGWSGWFAILITSIVFRGCY